MSPSFRISDISLRLAGFACMVCLLAEGAFAQGGGNTGTATPPLTTGGAATATGAGNAGGGASTAEKTPEQISTEAGLGGDTSGELTVQSAPDGSSGVFIYGHWVNVRASAGDQVNWTASDGEIQIYIHIARR